MSLVQRDYILRLFEQMGQVITVVIGLKKNGEPSEALRVASDGLHGLVGFNLEDIEKLAAEDIVQLIRLSRSGHASPGEQVAGQLGVVGRFLTEIADIHDIQAEPERADRARLKALHIYLVVLVEEQSSIDEVQAAIALLVGQLSGYVLPFAISDMLWRHYEMRGDFARAEDTLFEMLETGGHDQGVVDNAIAFYQRLLEKADNDLEEGGLPRDEVLAGLSELQAV
jgi:hypothetical protein